ncbi:MAG: LysR family transcriptional regulator [Capsulimonadaceae bacterium]|nr:LysR family transcriptional regulator [Capsulimonadaceae bacterium]
MIDLRHMRYFVAVAEELHFGRAAEKLYIAQPPLSHQIKQLEQQIGVKLLERNRRRVRLTEAGAVFLEQARRTLAQAEFAVQAAHNAATGEPDSIEIGFVSSATYHDVIPAIIRVFRERHPRVVMALHELTSAQQAQALLDGSLHIGFVRPPIGEVDLTLQTVLYEPFLVALPSTHPLASESALSITSIANDPFVMLPRHLNLSLYDQIIAICQTAGFRPRVSQEATQLQTITSLVAAGLGVSLVPESLKNVRRSGIVYKRLLDVSARIEMAAAYRKDQPATSLQLLLNVIQEVSGHAGAGD